MQFWALIAFPLIDTNRSHEVNVGSFVVANSNLLCRINLRKMLKQNRKNIFSIEHDTGQLDMVECLLHTCTLNTIYINEIDCHLCIQKKFKTGIWNISVLYVKSVLQMDDNIWWWEWCFQRGILPKVKQIYSTFFDIFNSMSYANS